MGSLLHLLFRIFEVRGNKHPFRQRIWSFNPLKLRRYCRRLSWKHIHHCNQDKAIKVWPLQAWYYNLLRSDKYQAANQDLSSCLQTNKDLRGISWCLIWEWPSLKQELIQIYTLVIVFELVSHSFWIGAATVVHIKGIEDSTIMTLRRWKSNAYQRYVRIPQEHLAQLSSRITTPIPPTNSQVFHPLPED